MTGPPGPVVIRLEHGPESVDRVGPVLTQAGIRLGQPVVVLVGGASGMSTADAATASALFDAALVPALRTTGAGLVDGGTNAGVMALAGSARSRAGLGGIHIGVIAAGTLAQVGGNDPSSDPVEMEPHHSHVLVVPGADWGDESPWLSRIATVLSDGQPSVTLLVNGGEIAYQDIELSLSAGRPAIVISGTGRTADDIAGTPPATPRARALARSPLVQVIPATASAVLDALRRSLKGG
jgi:SLOG in TRPM, prokaryote